MNINIIVISIIVLLIILLIINMKPEHKSEEFVYIENRLSDFKYNIKKVIFAIFPTININSLNNKLVSYGINTLDVENISLRKNKRSTRQIYYLFKTNVLYYYNFYYNTLNEENFRISYSNYLLFNNLIYKTLPLDVKINIEKITDGYNIKYVPNNKKNNELKLINSITEYKTNNCDKYICYTSINVKDNQNLSSSIEELCKLVIVKFFLAIKYKTIPTELVSTINSFTTNIK